MTIDRRNLVTAQSPATPVRPTESSVEALVTSQPRQLSQIVLDAVPAMIAVLDREGTILTVNEGWKQYGLENGPADRCFGVGQNYLRVCEAAAATVPEAAEVSRAIRKVLAEETDRFEVEYSCVTPTEIKWFCLIITAMRDPELSGVIATHLDITARRRAEAMALAAERLAVAGRMAATVAHEVNNPLAGIKNAFALVKGDVNPTSAHVGLVPLIESEIDRIGRIVRQLLDLHRPDRESPRRFRIADTATEVVTLMTSTARVRGIRIVTEIPDDGCPVTTAEGSLRQILFNLIRNAIDASPTGGKILIVARRQGWEHVEIQVTDEGAGIPEMIAERIFEPFFSTKTFRDDSGTGLGLAICRSLAQSMGGTIHANSTPGHGSTFTITLPALQGA